MFSHSYMQKYDPYDRPWLTDITDNSDKRQDKAATVEVKAMKGKDFTLYTFGNQFRNNYNRYISIIL